MAIAVGSGAVVAVVRLVESQVIETVRNNGPNAVTLSKDPKVVAGAGFQVAAAAVQDVDLAPGESLFAICAGGQTASLEVI